MHLKKDAVDPGSYGSAGKRGDELRLSAGNAVRRGGHLDRVGPVEDHGREPPQNGQRAHVHYKVAVAEGGAALGERDTFIAGRSHFFDCVAHIAGCDELAFFYIHRAAGLPGGHQQVGLAAQESRDLQYVHAFGGNLAMRGFVHVGQHGEARGLGNGAQDARTFAQAGTAKAGDGGAVGLVVGSLKDVRHAEIGGNASDAFRHASGVGFGFNDARAADKEKLARADGYIADFEVRNHTNIGAQNGCKDWSLQVSWSRDGMRDIKQLRQLYA